MSEHISSSMNHYYPSGNYNESHHDDSLTPAETNAGAKAKYAEEYKKYEKAFCYWNLEQFQGECQKLKEATEKASQG